MIVAYCSHGLAWLVDVSVCVDHVREPSKKRQNNQDAIREGVRKVGTRNHALDGSADPQGQGVFCVNVAATVKYRDTQP